MQVKKNIVRRHVDTVPVFEQELHPVLARVYAARELVGADDLDHSLDRILSYSDLKGIDTAVELLVEALSNNGRILIVADFDADGATSCALVTQALRMMGASHVEYLVPNRFEYGYGLTPEIVAVATEYTPDLLVTVDNGISSITGVKAATDAGMKVLITDHHLPGEELPDANAIVNPNQSGDIFISKNLAGVGVIFYVMLALRARLRDSGWFADRKMEAPNLATLLDLVALGTVADVVPLDRNNRILVDQGLRRIRAGHCCEGIKALLEVSGRNSRAIVASDLGYAIAPRLNAAGRLEDMSLGIDCLLSDNPDQARKIAKRLDELNIERRDIESSMQEQALEIIQTLHLEQKKDLPAAMCLYDERWHQGVIGIVASRIKERLHRPVIAFAPGEQGEIKGSARSIAGLHIRDILDAVAARHSNLLSKFGGHAMAAGLSIPRENLEPFREAFVTEVERLATPDIMQGVYYSDGELSENDLDLSLAENLRHAGPWGQGFPEPVFDGRFEVVEKRIVAEKHLKMVLRIPGGRRCIDAIAFNTVDTDWPADSNCVEVVYRLDVNEFRGQRSPQLMVEQVVPV